MVEQRLTVIASEASSHWAGAKIGLLRREAVIRARIRDDRSLRSQ